jgi:hypothetical protein
MHATMNVGVIFTVVARDGVNNGGGLLSRCGAVKVDQWMSADRLVEDGKILAPV